MRLSVSVYMSRLALSLCFEVMEYLVDDVVAKVTLLTVTLCGCNERSINYISRLEADLDVLLKPV